MFFELSIRLKATIFDQKLKKYPAICIHTSLTFDLHLSAKICPVKFLLDQIQNWP